MLLSTFLASLLLSVASTSANIMQDQPPFRMSLSRRLNLTSVHNIARHDQERAKNLKNWRAKSKTNINTRDSANSSMPIYNQAVTYIASIGVGSPPTYYDLVVDTGSSNTWVGANGTNRYASTSSSSLTSEIVAVQYGSGSFLGLEYEDKVTIAKRLVILKQSIGVAEYASGFNGVDGIIGLGPTELTEGTLYPSFQESIPTVLDNLFEQAAIPQKLFGVHFKPTTVSDGIDGEITFGGVDDSEIIGLIHYTPLTKTDPADRYWGVDSSMLYGTSQTILPNSAGIVDTGTTLVLISSNAFNIYKSSTGAVEDSVTGLLRFTPAQYSTLQSLNVIVGNATFELTPNAQIWPRNLNTDIGGTAASIYSIIGDLGSTITGLDFILGMAFLQRFYSVYDVGNQRVGLASTPYTNATTN